MTKTEKTSRKTESASNQPSGFLPAEAIEAASSTKPAASKKPRTVDWHHEKDPVTHRTLWVPGPAKKKA